MQANPTHSEFAGEGKRGKVYAHVTVRQQEEWLLGKAEKCGFALSEKHFHVIGNDALRFNRQGGTVTIGVAVYEGVLRVIDGELFKNILVNGIGRAKAYGCGLLTVMPL